MPNHQKKGEDYVKFDSHVHTPFCPHGTNDTFEEYIEQAINLKIKEITFTEHAPLPINFHDPTPDKDSGMKLEDLGDYFEILQKLKAKYQSKISINVGLEVDYILGYEEETKQFLNEYGKFLDDSILSVHFLQKEKKYYCLDFSEQEFLRMITKFGSIQEIYKCYYSTLKSSILADLGEFKPKRIGHITLVHKFQKRFPCPQFFTEEIEEILLLLKQHKLQLDYNGSGVNKPLCLEPYPPEWVIKRAIEYDIPLIYGSDAHSAKDIGQGYKMLYSNAKLVSPTLHC